MTDGIGHRGPVPSPYMQGVVPNLWGDLAQPENLILAPRTGRASHRRRLATLDDLLSTHYEAPALFLAYRTRGLSDLLSTDIMNAEAATG